MMKKKKCRSPSMEELSEKDIKNLMRHDSFERSNRRIRVRGGRAVVIK